MCSHPRQAVLQERGVLACQLRTRARHAGAGGSEQHEPPCKKPKALKAHSQRGSRKRTHGDGLAVQRAGGRPAAPVAVLAAVAQQRVATVRARPVCIGVGLVHVLAIPHVQAVAAEDALLQEDSRQKFRTLMGAGSVRNERRGRPRSPLSAYVGSCRRRRPDEVMLSSRFQQHMT